MEGTFYSILFLLVQSQCTTVVHSLPLRNNLRKETNPCNRGRCPAPPILYNEKVFNFRITSGMTLNAPDALPLLPSSRETTHSFDESNFAAMSFRLSLRLCGEKDDLQIYQATLTDIDTRCNDLSGELESASDNSETHMKMARSMEMCDQYPLFTDGPSPAWFSVAMERGGSVLGVDFPNANQIKYMPVKLAYADQSFKKHLIKDLLFATPSTVCLPAQNVQKCMHIDRNETLLLTTHQHDEHGPGSVAASNNMDEKVKRKLDCTYEITSMKSHLNRADCFETATFETTPLGLDSVQPVVRKAMLQTRWEMVREEVQKIQRSEACIIL